MTSKDTQVTPPRSPSATPKLLRILGALFLFIAAILPAETAPAYAAASVRLSDGHTDIFNVDAPGGALRLTVKEDITGHGVLRDPGDVVLVVKQQAKTALSGQFSQFGESGYVLPLVQQPGLLWPGWDTQNVVGAGFSAVDIIFDEVTGPGNVYLATQAAGLGGGIAPLLADGGYEVRSGSSRHQDPPAHTHAYWVFTAPGTYRMRVHAAASGKVSQTHTYTWEVGDITSAAPGGAADPAPGGAADPAPGETADPDTSSPTPTTVTTAPSRGSVTAKTSRAASPAPAPSFDALNDPWLNSPAQDAGSSSGSSGASRPVVVTTVTRARPVAQSAASTPAAAPQAAASAPAAPTCVADAPHLVPIVRDDRTSPARDRAPEELTFALGEASTATTTETIGVIPNNTPVWMIGATQVSGVPWLGVNTMDPTLRAETTGPVELSLTGFDGPGDMEVFTSGNFGTIVGNRWFSATPGAPSGSVSINPNTHVHPNWVFTQPGTYHLTITQRATARSGAALVADTPVTIVVGSTNGITEGHFDLGSTVRTVAQPCGGAAAPVAPAAARPRQAAAPATAPVAAGLAHTGVGDWAWLLGGVGICVGLLGLTLVTSGRYRPGQRR